MWACCYVFNNLLIWLISKCNKNNPTITRRVINIIKKDALLISVAINSFVSLNNS